jgi:hypothetical protein
MRIIAGNDLDALETAVRSLRHANDQTEGGLLAEPLRLATAARDTMDDEAEGTYEDSLRTGLRYVDECREETQAWLEFAATMHVAGRVRTSNETYEAVTGACRSAMTNLDDWADWACAELRDLD